MNKPTPEQQKEIETSLVEFGQLVLNGFGGDFDKMIAGIQTTNKTLKENSGLIPFITDPKNEPILGEISGALSGNKKISVAKMIGIFSKLMK